VLHGRAHWGLDAGNRARGVDALGAMRAIRGRPGSPREAPLTRRHRDADPDKTHPTIEDRRLDPRPPGVEPGPRPVDPAGATVSWQPALPADPEAPGADGGTAALAGSPARLLRRVGQFVLLERLGAGGMGVVFAAFDEKLERKVAIKLVATHGGNERAQQRLLREAQAQARLSHPNVVTVYEVDTLPEGKLFIAMELVRGPTLGTWQDEAARTWPEIVAMYSAAGEGLAAAHRGGVVHRDFKPDNALVGDDGRVRVADFGLAFAAEPEDAAITGAADGQDTMPSGPRPALTAVGAVVGTPGYMAPEQFTVAAADARSDQFSFCVALYEALHGERPYADLAFLNGARPAPRCTEPDPAYPRWLWDVVMRGLALAPGERFASMDALLAELTRSRARTRRRVLTAAALVGTLAIVGVTSSALTGHSPPACPPATGELAGIWDLATKPRIQAALLGTGTPFAASVWASTEAAFDRYAERWIGAQQAACEATHVRHVQSAQLLDRRMDCLAGRRRSLAAAAEVLQSRPLQAVEHAGEILGSLGDIALCADTGVLLALPGVGSGVASQANPGTQAVVAEVRRHLARAEALLATGDVGAAEPVVTEAVQLAQDLHDDPLHAELRYLEGRVKLTRGEVADSIALFNQAVELAVSSHHDELPADVWLTLAVSAGSREQRPAEIELWLGQGEAWIRRLGHASDPRRVAVERARGKLQLIAGNAREALITLSHAFETAETLWGKDDPRLIPLLRDRALVQARLRQAKPAVADGERALAIGIAAWGTEYPDIARTRLALGLLYIEQLGAVERGEQELRLALALYRTQLGADSIEVANCEQALSQAGQYRGDYAAALGHAERAEQIFAKRLGPEHPRRGEALMGLGVLRFMRKDFTGSLAAYEAAYPILRAALGPAHTTVGLLLSNTGETLLALGRAEPAKANFEKALDILRSSLGPDHANLALPLKGLGLAQLSRGRPNEALAPLDRALVLRTQSAAASDPQELAEIRWGIARTLRALGRESTRAHELAEAALAGYRGLGDESVERVQEISRWLRL
jgi:tetratricopeptide (TPR) repeat protein